MKFQRYYKYLIKPNHEQKQIIIRIFGAVRFVHNRYLDDMKAGKPMRRLAKSIIDEYRSENPFLKEIDGSALINEIMQAQDRKIFKRYKKRQDGRASYCTANLTRAPIMIVNDHFIRLPKLGDVEFVYHRPIPEDARINKATVIREADGRYYISVLVEYYRKVAQIDLDPQNSIGIDYSSPHFFVDDNGNKVDMPHFYQRTEKRLAKENQKLRLMKKGSKNSFEQKTKIASIYQNLKDQRKDFLHKLTTEISDTYDIVCMEDLDMKKISQSFNLGKRTYDNSYGLFNRLLQYKMRDKGKLILYVDRYYPSSKLCSNCGYIKKDLKLSDRVWECPKCGTVHDRDINAAKNIKEKAISDYNCRRVSGVGL